MLLLRRTVFLLLLAVFALPLWPTHAQTASQTLTTPSGRLALQAPAAWVARPFPQEEEIRGLDSETLVIGTSFDVIDSYLAGEFFEGTVLFISAYPYNVFADEVLGDPAAMLLDVTVYDKADVKAKTFGALGGAEFYYQEAGRFFFSDALMDTGELAYRTSAYSTVFEDRQTLDEIFASFQPRRPSLNDLLASDTPTQTLRTFDERLSFEVPRNWLSWIEGDNGLSFATSGTAYENISYGYGAKGIQELAVVVQRFMKAALRPNEVGTDGRVDLTAWMSRVQAAGGLVKNVPYYRTEVDGFPALTGTWLVSAEGVASTLTYTLLIDGGDRAYLVQAQFPNKPEYLAVAERLLSSARYRPADSPLDPTQEGLEIGNLAPDFQADVLGGGQTRLSDYRSQVVFLNMWATWCGPCHREAPALQSVYSTYAGQFEILALNIGEPPALAQGFVDDYSLSFPVLLDEAEQIAALYNLRAYPTTYIIGRNGVIIEKIEGSFSEEGLLDLMTLYVVGNP